MRGAGVAAPGDHVLMVPTVAGGWRNLVKTDVNKWFKARIRNMNLDDELYMLHGYRHGAVALALAEQPNLALVRLQSDHFSEAIWSYSQVEVERRKSVAAVMLDAVERFGRQQR